MASRVDAHHHLWQYDPRQYGWIDDRMQVLQRDYLPKEFEAQLASAGVSGSIVVQVRQSIEETEWLLNLASRHPSVWAVVGWAPIASADFPLFLERFAGQTKLKGLRHIIQDEPDDRFILRQDFNRGIALMKTSGLIYEILIHQHHLPCAVEFVDQHPDQVFVLDHLAKPRIREGKIDPWQKYLANLARRENVYCKISGMVTEADWSNWRPEDLRPYFDVVLDVFGPRRLIAGSDWPVCLLAASYERWWQTLREFLSDLSASEQDCILGTNAVRVYRLDDRSTASDREGAASESAHYQATR